MASAIPLLGYDIARGEYDAGKGRRSRTARRRLIGAAAALAICASTCALLLFAAPLRSGGSAAAAAAAAAVAGGGPRVSPLAAAAVTAAAEAELDDFAIRPVARPPAAHRPLPPHRHDADVPTANAAAAPAARNADAFPAAAAAAAAVDAVVAPPSIPEDDPRLARAVRRAAPLTQGAVSFGQLAGGAGAGGRTAAAAAVRNPFDHHQPGDPLYQVMSAAFCVVVEWGAVGALAPLLQRRIPLVPSLLARCRPPLPLPPSQPLSSSSHPNTITRSLRTSCRPTSSPPSSASS